MCYLCSFVSAVYEFVCANFFLFLCISATAAHSNDQSISDEPSNGNTVENNNNLNTGGLAGAALLAAFTGGKLEEFLLGGTSGH